MANEMVNEARRILGGCGKEYMKLYLLLDQFHKRKIKAGDVVREVSRCPDAVYMLDRIVKVASQAIGEEPEHECILATALREVTLFRKPDFRTLQGEALGALQSFKSVITLKTAPIPLDVVQTICKNLQYHEILNFAEALGKRGARLRPYLLTQSRENRSMLFSGLLKIGSSVSGINDFMIRCIAAAHQDEPTDLILTPYCNFNNLQRFGQKFRNISVFTHANGSDRVAFLASLIGILKRCQDVRCLRLGSELAPITDANIARFPPNLEDLSLIHDGLSDQVKQKIIQRYPTLKTLRVHLSSDEALHNILTTCQQLRTLVVRGRLRDGIASAPFPESLEWLDLSSADIGDEGLHWICESCPNLKVIILNGCEQITLQAFNNAEWPKGLQALSVKNTSLEGKLVKDWRCLVATRVIDMCPELRCFVVDSNWYYDNGRYRVLPRFHHSDPVIDTPPDTMLTQPQFRHVAPLFL